VLADLAEYGRATEVHRGVDAVVHLASIPAPEIHTPATTLNQNMTSSQMSPEAVVCCDSNYYGVGLTSRSQVWVPNCTASQGLPRGGV
jgi:hypothetical protein